MGKAVLLKGKGMLTQRVIKTLMCCAAGAYSVLRGYENFRHPAVGMPWFKPYSLIVLAGLAFFYGFEIYFHREKGGAHAAKRSMAPAPLTQGQRIIFGAAGLLVVAVGLVLLSLGGWLAREWGRSITGMRRITSGFTGSWREVAGSSGLSMGRMGRSWGFGCTGAGSMCRRRRM